MIFDDIRTALSEQAVQYTRTVSVSITFIIKRCFKASPPISTSADGTGHILRQGWILAASTGSGFKGASQLLIKKGGIKFASS
jgi:hypothetical protein